MGHPEHHHQPNNEQSPLRNVFDRLAWAITPHLPQFIQEHIGGQLTRLENKARLRQEFDTAFTTFIRTHAEYFFIEPITYTTRFQNHIDWLQSKARKIIAANDRQGLEVHMADMKLFENSKRTKDPWNEDGFLDIGNKNWYSTPIWRNGMRDTQLEFARGWKWYICDEQGQFVQVRYDFNTQKVVLVSE